MIVAIENRIEHRLKEILEAYPDLFLVDLQLKGHTGNQKLQVEIDGDHGLPIERCAEVSRALGSWIEEEDVISGKYLLEVTSPGADQPFKNRRQFRKNIGRELKIVNTAGEELVGTLADVEDKKIKIQSKKSDGDAIEIPFEQIKSTNVIISFK